MNKQRTVYLLLPLVAAVWGLIAWRIWLVSSEPATTDDSLVPVSVVITHPIDTAPPHLLLAYGDPFKPVAAAFAASNAAPMVGSPRRIVTQLTYARLPAASTLRFPARPIAATLPTSPPVTWPQVKYLGIISHANGQAQVALLMIEGEETIVRVGKSTHGLQVLRVFRDSVMLSFNKQRKSFFRTVAD